jgi:signal transduction histidine kinase
MLRIIGIMADITERKFAEEALASVSRRLIEAQEEERAWIARELHDDINQRIALLANQLEQWAQHSSNSVVEVTDHIRRACQDVSKLGTDIQALSHRLHSSKLEYLGLAAAARSFCEESSEQQKVEIEFSHAGIPPSLPKEISLCLFRVLQEGLQNAVKHSGERHFRVELHGTSRGIQLTVNDLGVGFDEQDAMSRRGLGLISMRERMQLVGGAVSIESKPGSGTTIRAWAPFIAEEHRASAAG